MSFELNINYNNGDGPTYCSDNGNFYFKENGLTLVSSYGQGAYFTEETYLLQNETYDLMIISPEGGMHVSCDLSDYDQTYSTEAINIYYDMPNRDMHMVSIDVKYASDLEPCTDKEIKFSKTDILTVITDENGTTSALLGDGIYPIWIDDIKFELIIEEGNAYSYFNEEKVPYICLHHEIMEKAYE